MKGRHWMALSLVMAAIALAAVALQGRVDAGARDTRTAMAGRYVVAAGQDSEYVLCDTITGKTWYVDLDAKDDPEAVVWMPVLRRLETRDEVRAWKKRPGK